MAQSRSVGTLVYPVEAGNAGTRTVRESVPPVQPTPRLLDRLREALRVRHDTHVLNRGPAGVRSPADRMFNP